MRVPIDTEAWSGEGEFTEALVEALSAMPGLAALRVEDSPASRNDAGYAFISNEIYARSEVRREVAARPRLVPAPWRRRVEVRLVSLADIEARLTALDGIGPPDFADEGMIQYLRTHRIVAPYQTRGVKVVEMVRIYMARHDSRNGPAGPAAAS